MTMVVWSVILAEKKLQKLDTVILTDEINYIHFKWNVGLCEIEE